MALLVTSEYTKDLYGPNVAYTSFGKDKSSCQTIDSQGGTMGEVIKTKNLEEMLKLVVVVLAWCWCPAVHLKVKMLHKNWVFSIHIAVLESIMEHEAQNLKVPNR